MREDEVGRSQMCGEKSLRCVSQQLHDIFQRQQHFHRYLLIDLDPFTCNSGDTLTIRILFDFLAPGMHRTSIKRLDSCGMVSFYWPSPYTLPQDLEA